MRIRLLRKKDISAAARIVTQNYSPHYGRIAKGELGAMFRNKVGGPSYVVAEERGKIIGFAGFVQSWMDFHVYHIFWVNVAPQYQNKGIGTALVKRAITEIKRKRGEDKKAAMILITTTSPAYYKKRFGFKTLALLHRKKYHLMALSLER